jgi:hypothetical protein
VTLKEIDFLQEVFSGKAALLGNTFIGNAVSSEQFPVLLQLARRFSPGRERISHSLVVYL